MQYFVSLVISIENKFLSIMLEKKIQQLFLDGDNNWNIGTWNLKGWETLSWNELGK